MSGISIAKSLELHLHQPLVTPAEVRAGCAQAAGAHLAEVCVWPTHVAIAAEALAGSDTRVRAAIGHPFGQDPVANVVVACDRAVRDGADDLAVMLDHSGLLDGGSPKDALQELDQLLAHSWWSSLGGGRSGAELSIVLETTMIDPDALAPLLARLHDSPAGFVQTGSGHQARAVTEHHVRELRERAPADVAIVAVGGVATCQDAEALVVAGAVRIGSGGAIAIIDQERHARDQRQATT